MDLQQPTLQWCENEFSGVNFGDPRLNRRFLFTAIKLSEQPLASINAACESWSNAKAAYRLFSNSKIRKEEILRSHQVQTRRRIDEHSVVLAIQDTSSLNYSHHEKTRGLGFVHSPDDAKGRGILMHTTFAVTTKGLPLGILTQDFWIRPGEEKKKHLRKRLPIEKKESFKWLKAAQATKGLLQDSDPKIVYICDRESDIYPFLSEVKRLDHNFLIRAAWDRRINTKESEQRETTWAYMRSQPVLTELEIEVPARRAQKARQASLEVRVGEMILRHNKNTGKKPLNKSLSQVRVNAVWVKEINPSPEVEALEWMLLTDLDVTNAPEAIEKINWYKLRWEIEVYHKILKTGCQVEACRLADRERLERYVTLLSVVAWRIYWATYVSRVAPQNPATIALKDHEWKALYCRINKTSQAPDTPPTIYQTTRWIAQLGGFLGRKSDGNPGPITLWRGWQRLQDLAEGYLLGRPPPTCG